MRRTRRSCSRSPRPIAGAIAGTLAALVLAVVGCANENSGTASAGATPAAADTSAVKTAAAATTVAAAPPPATTPPPAQVSASPSAVASAAPSASASAGAPAASGSAAAGAKTFDCGAKGQKPCPMQGWMKGVMAGASSSGDAEKLASALSYVAARPPPGMGTWVSIANGGAAKAKAGDIDGAKASCKQCHDAYKQKYIATMRDRPF